MKVSVFVPCAVVMFLIYCDVGLGSYSLECPETSHWKIRADRKCNGTTDKYHCLYDQNKEEIKEFCASPKDYTAGLMAVYRRNIDADLCPGYRYMPLNVKSNTAESSIFLKSKCNGEGQLVHHNWSLAEDVACTCDFSNGYAFIKQPNNKCYCVPSQEDCSCYRKQCDDSNYVLSPDYSCNISKLVKTQPLDSNNFQCHPYQHRMKLLKNDRMKSISSCSSDCFTKVTYRDKGLLVIIECARTMVTIALSLSLICLIFLAANCLNGEEVINVNDTTNGISQTDDVRREIDTELPKKSDDELYADDYFSIHCEREVLKFYYGVELQKESKEQPRILDMCFVEIHKKIYLVYIDADNKKIMKRDISNDSIKPGEYQLTLEPNRLAKINNSFIGVIYKKKFDILVLNVETMNKFTIYSISQGDIMKSTNGIQGILALSKKNFILSDKIHLHRFKLEKGKKDAVVNIFATSVKEFDTARRLTHITVSQNRCQDVIFIADENDKKLTSIGKTTGEYIDDHKGFKRGLQNVRAIGATENRVYAATSAGIAVFPHNEGVFAKFVNQGNDTKDFRMLLDYKYHVEHTRGLCIHLDKGYIYMGLSCVIKQNDVIFLFRFKPNDTFQ